LNSGPVPYHRHPGVLNPQEAAPPERDQLVNLKEIVTSPGLTNIT